MPVALRHPEPSDGIPLEVELYEHNRLSADDPAVVAGFDGHNLGRLVLHDTPVRVFDVDLATDEEANVRMHTEVGADGRLHVH